MAGWNIEKENRTPGEAQDKALEIANKGGAFERWFISKDKPKGKVILIYGDSGSGKTYFALTCLEPVYVVDFESRAIHCKHYHFPNKNIKINEPIEFKTKSLKEDENALDVHTTINDLTRFIVEFANQVKAGEITEGTIVIDGVTDVWSLIQEWGVYELAKYSNKDGTKKANVMLQRISSQLDWKVPNQKHAETIGILRSLIKYGINVVFTAREQQIPDYVNLPTIKDRIRCQKDVPFMADIIVRLQAIKMKGDTKFVATIEKLEGLPVPSRTIEKLTFDSLLTIINEQTKLLGDKK